MKKINFLKIASLPFLFFLNGLTAFAHCPLCTIGAAAAAGGAAYLGVSSSVIGIFIGAFAVSMGWWVGRIIKKKIIPYQRAAIILLSFLTTVLPLIPFLKNLYPLYIPFLGQYGTTLAVDLFLIGSIIGGAVVCITPLLSKKITQLRKGKQIPYQGISLTFALLFLIGITLQFVL